MPIAAKLDELGKPAWIALMILAFIVFWPLGLAVLAYLIGSGRMGCWKRGHHGGPFGRWHESAERMRGHWHFPRTSGNRAFDEYRMETLKRLEDEQAEFQDFLERLRLAKDKQEFDAFMAERRNRPSPPTGSEPQPQA